MLVYFTCTNGRWGHQPLGEPPITKNKLCAAQLSPFQPTLSFTPIPYRYLFALNPSFQHNTFPLSTHYTALLVNKQYKAKHAIASISFPFIVPFFFKKKFGIAYFGIVYSLCYQKVCFPLLLLFNHPACKACR